MIYLVVVNGKPESGKTTFEKMCEEYIDSCEYGLCYVDSSIDPVKNIMEMMGWDGKKTEQSRRDMAYMKSMWDRMSNGTSKYLLSLISQYEDNTDDVVIFYDVREPNNILMIQDMVEHIPFNIHMTTLLVVGNDSDKVIGNDADDNVEKFEYKHIICNLGTEEQLREMAHNFIDMYMEV